MIELQDLDPEFIRSWMMPLDNYWLLYEDLNAEYVLDDLRSRLVKLTWKNFTGHELRQRSLLCEAWMAGSGSPRARLPGLIETMLHGKRSWESLGSSSHNAPGTLSFDIDDFYRMGNDVWFERHVANSKMIRANPWKIANAILDFEELIDPNRKWLLEE